MGEFLCHGQGIDGTGYHAITTKYTPGEIQGVLLRIASFRNLGMDITHNPDRLGWTNGFTKVATHASFHPVVISSVCDKSPVTISQDKFFFRILNRNLPEEHVAES
jgi:hypothetical protein